MTPLTAATALHGLALPFNTPTTIAERRDDGSIVMFRETFDSASFAGSVPEKLPVHDHHRQHRPVGWARTRVADRGLEVEVELIDSPSAQDVRAAAEADLKRGLSVGFRMAPSADRWTKPDGDGLPSVLRRGVELVEVSFVTAPAYREARIERSGTSWSDEAEAERVRLSDEILRPVREQRAREEAERRRAHDELLAWVDEAVARQAEMERRPEPVPEPELAVATREGVDMSWYPSGRRWYMPPARR